MISRSRIGRETDPRAAKLAHAGRQFAQGAPPVYTSWLSIWVAGAHVALGHMSSSRWRDSRIMRRKTARTADSASGPGLASTTSFSTARSRAGARTGNPAARFDCAILRTSRARRFSRRTSTRSEEHTSELQSQSNLVCRLLLEKKKTAAAKLPFSTRLMLATTMDLPAD